jgi:hypothetical protein
MLDQNQANQVGTPSGVLLAEGLSLQDQGGRRLGAGGGPVIGRRRHLPAVFATAPQQVVDGTQADVETPRQGPGRQPTLVAAEHGLTEVLGKGSGHGTELLEKATAAARGLPPP